MKNLVNYLDDYMDDEESLYESVKHMNDVKPKILRKNNKNHSNFNKKQKKY